MRFIRDLDPNSSRGFQHSKYCHGLINLLPAEVGPGTLSYFLSATRRRLSSATSRGEVKEDRTLLQACIEGDYEAVPGGG